jgi:uncharacterized membrane protein
VLAHLLPGLLVTAVALLGTAPGVAAGALASSLLTLLVLASVWGLGLVLGLAGVLVGLGARRALRRVATVGLAIAAVWGIVVLPALVFRQDLRELRSGQSVEG